MGNQHGELLRDLVHISIDEYLTQTRKILGLDHALLLSQAKVCERYVPEEYRLEMKAIAAASGVAYDDILALNCLVDVDACMNRQIAQCCNMVLTPPATVDGLVLHARNLDFPHLGIMCRGSVVIVRRPTDENCLPTVAITWAGFVGLLTGCNSRKITAAEVGSLAKDSALEGTCIGFLMREALERCGSVAEFGAFVKSSRRTAGFNLALCDGKNGESMAVEYTHSLCEFRKARTGVLVVDDACLCPRTSRDRLCYTWGAFRHARAVDLAQKNFGRIDAAVAIGFLQDRYDMAYGIPNGRGYRCICNRDTVQSVIFIANQDRMLVSHEHVPAPKGTYSEIDLSKMWSGNLEAGFNIV